MTHDSWRSFLGPQATLAPNHDCRLSTFHPQSLLEITLIGSSGLHNPSCVNFRDRHILAIEDSSGMQIETLLPGIPPDNFARRYALEVRKTQPVAVQKNTALWNALKSLADVFLGNISGLRNSRGKSPQNVYHIILPNRRFNASADFFEGCYIVCLEMGAYLACLDVSHSLLVTRGVLPGIGDDKNEYEPMNWLLGARHKDLQFASIQDYLNDLAVRMPKNEYRRNVAAILSSLMLQFILIHEQMHILLGHRDHYGKIIEEELNDPSVARRLYEAQADKHALHWTLTPLSIQYLLNSYPQLGNFGATQAIALTITANFLSTMLLIPPSDPFDSIEFVELWGDHPHSALRVRESLLPSMIQNLQKKFPDYATHFRDGYKLAILWIDGIASIYPQYEVYKHLFEIDGILDRAITCYNRINTRGFQKITASLEPYVFR